MLPLESGRKRKYRKIPALIAAGGALLLIIIVILIMGNYSGLSNRGGGSNAARDIGERPDTAPPAGRAASVPDDSVAEQNEITELMAPARGIVPEAVTGGSTVKISWAGVVGARGYEVTWSIARWNIPIFRKLFQETGELTTSLTSARFAVPNKSGKLTVNIRALGSYNGERIYSREQLRYEIKVTETSPDSTLPDPNQYHRQIAIEAAVYAMLAYDETRIATARPERGTPEAIYNHYLNNYARLAGRLYDLDSDIMVYSGARNDGCGVEPLLLRAQLALDGYRHVITRNYANTSASSADASQDIGYTLASRKLKNGQYLVAVVLRGTDSSEWYGNMEVGHGVRHASFEYANKLALQPALKAYIREFCPGTVNFFITGHSRGAAVANLLAADITGGEADIGTTAGKVFAYTFATPNTTTDRQAGERYGNIFNFCLADDFVSRVPLALWGYGRYGVSFSSTAEDVYDHNPVFYVMMNEYARLSYAHLPLTQQWLKSDVPVFDQRAVRAVIASYEKLCPTVAAYYGDKRRYAPGYEAGNSGYRTMSMFDFMHNYVAAAVQKTVSFETASLLVYAMPTEYYPIRDFLLKDAAVINYSHQAFTYWLALKCDEFALGDYEDSEGRL